MTERQKRVLAVTLIVHLIVLRFTYPRPASAP